MRRLILEEPVSRAALWSRRLGAFAIAVAGLALFLSRAGAMEPANAIVVFGASLVLACVAALLSGAAAVVIWRTGRRGAGAAALGLALALALLAWPARLLFEAIALPPINDVSTDLDNPPSFLRSARALEARDGRTPPEPTAAMRDEQKRAYPKVQPVMIDMEPAQAYQLALRLARERGWRIVDSVPPSVREGIGHIDATERSAFFGFTDDIAIRITPLVNATRIDLRSASRIGKHDFGANAAHIEGFAADALAVGGRP
jgi:uncharacterized protein (DUF1499 family)